MKFICDKELLQKNLSLLERITGKHSSLPVLQAVVFVVGNKKLILRATNLDISVELEMPVKIEQEGSCAVLPQPILSLLSGSRSVKQVTCSEQDGVFTYKAEHTTSTIKTLPLGDFPSFPTIPTEAISITLPIQKITKGIASVVWSTNPSDIRPEFSSVYIAKDGGSLVFVATDSYRLAEKKINISLEEELPGILIPQKNAGEIVRFFENLEGDVVLSYTQHHLSLVTPGIKLSSRLMDGLFPDYKKIIPTDTTTTAVILKQDIIDALKISNAFSDKWNHTTLAIDTEKGETVISVKNQDIGETISRIEGALSGLPLETAFNYRYMLDGLSQIKEDSVSIDHKQGSKPLLVRGVGDSTFLYLVVPMNK